MARELPDDLHIEHITPAQPGWFAVYKDCGKTCRIPIAFWAVCSYEDDDDDDGKPIKFQTMCPVGVDGHGIDLVFLNEDNPGSITMGEYLGIAAPGEDMPCSIVRASHWESLRS